MARNLISSDAAIRAIKPGDPRKRLSDGDGLVPAAVRQAAARTAGASTTASTASASMLSLGHLSRHVAGPRPPQGRRRRGSCSPKASTRASSARPSEGSAGAAPRTSEREAQGLPAVELVRGRRSRVVRGAAGRLGARATPTRSSPGSRTDVFPWIGRAPVADITPPQLLEVLRRIEARGVVETAHRALQDSSQVFRYAVATGQATTQPGARPEGCAAAARTRSTSRPSSSPKRFGELLRACDGYAATPVVRAALKLAPMLLLRPGELRFAEWPEIDLDAALWTVPAVRMKRELREKLNGAPHLVPLPKQAVAVSARAARADRARGKMVFRGERHHDRRDEREHGQRGAAGDGLLQPTR